MPESTTPAVISIPPGQTLLPGPPAVAVFMVRLTVGDEEPTYLTLEQAKRLWLDLNDFFAGP